MNVKLKEQVKDAQWEELGHWKMEKVVHFKDDDEEAPLWRRHHQMKQHPELQGIAVATLRSPSQGTPKIGFGQISWSRWTRLCPLRTNRTPQVRDARAHHPFLQSFLQYGSNQETLLAAGMRWRAEIQFGKSKHEQNSINHDTQKVKTDQEQRPTEASPSEAHGTQYAQAHSMHRQTKTFIIKTHDSESRGQEEAGHTRRTSVLFTGSTTLKL